MATYTKRLLSGSTNGRPIKVAATATPGTTIHTAVTGTTDFDEVWIYNVLQHTIDPGDILNKATKIAKMIRIFEWLDTGKNVGHPHTITKEFLDDHLKADGRTVSLDGESGCYGTAYHGAYRARTAL